MFHTRIHLCKKHGPLPSQKSSNLGETFLNFSSSILTGCRKIIYARITFNFPRHQDKIESKTLFEDMGDLPLLGINEA